MEVKMIVFLCFIGHLGLGQIVIKGNVQDIKIGAPIPYANIGILDTEAGTISNFDGSFQLIIPDSLKLERVIFSAIGYERTEIAVPKASVLNLKIALKEKPTILKEVEVRASKERNQKWLGNKKRGLLPGAITFLDSATAGGAVALLISKKDTALDYVEQVRVRVFLNTLSEFKIRVRFLEVDSLNDNQPGEDIIFKTIIASSSIRKGWLDIDLSDHNIIINQDKFYLMLEWLYEESDRIFMTKSYGDYLKKYADGIKSDTIEVNGTKIPYVDLPTNNFKQYLTGTFFYISGSKQLLKKMATYGRSSSFAPWIRKRYTLRTQVLMTD